MPNRIIKESIRTSKTVNAMTDFQFRLWAYLITYVDDFGCGSADPEILKGFVFPRRKRVTESDIKNALAELAGMGCILLYDVDGESYFCFPTWGDHQRIQAKTHRFPAPPAEVLQQNKTVAHGDSRNVTVTHGDSRNVTVTHGLNPNPNPNPNPNQNPNPTPLTGKRAGARDGGVFAELSEPMKEAMSEFKRFRTMAKKPMTTEAVERMLSRLEKLSGGDENKKIAILRQSIDRGWTDVYELKEEGHGQRQVSAGGHAQDQPFGTAGDDSAGKNTGSKLRYFGRPDLV